MARRLPSAMLMNMQASGALFHTATGTAFADVLINGQRQTWPIRGKRFRAWLRRRHYQETGQPLGAEAIRATLDLLEAQAQFDAPERAVHVRVAEHAGHIYLDLADEGWRAVEIGPGGWRVIGCPPVRFRRPAGMLPLPMPEPGGSMRPWSPAQPYEPQRPGVGRNVAVGAAAIPWPVSRASDIRRARIGEDRHLQAAQSIDRPQRCPGEGARARRTRAHDCSQSQLSARLRQSVQPTCLVLRRVLPARERWQLRGGATL